MADKISDLPPPTRPVTVNDLRVMQTLFGNDAVNYELKRLIVPGLAFVALSLPIVNKWMEKMMPSVSPTLFLAIKTGIFLLVVVVFQFFGLA